VGKTLNYCEHASFYYVSAIFFSKLLWQLPRFALYLLGELVHRDMLDL